MAKPLANRALAEEDSRQEENNYQLLIRAKAAEAQVASRQNANRVNL